MADAMSRVTSLVEPIVVDAGFELYDLVREGGIVRVTVDCPEGVGMDALRDVTKRVSICFDDHDPIPGTYTLEVTSPGLERTLRLPHHFQGAVGERISLKTKEPIDGKRRFAGVLIEVGDDFVVLDRTDVSVQQHLNGKSGGAKAKKAKASRTEVSTVEAPAATSGSAPSRSAPDLVAETDRIPLSLITRARTVFEWNSGSGADSTRVDRKATNS